YSDAAHGAGDSATTAFTVHLNGANDTPELSASLGATTYTDTAENDTFTAVTGQLTGSDRDTGDTATLTYGISGGTTGGSNTFGGVTYDVSKVGSFGTVYVKSSTGQYTFQENDAAINAAKTAGQTDSFTFTTTDTSSAQGTTSFVVTVNGVNDAPVNTVPAAQSTSKKHK